MQSGPEPELDLLPPPSLTMPLWRSLRQNFRDRFFPVPLPPLYLTSKPVDVGMLVGDLIGLPWYRTVFTNLGDVVSAETLPPLELESQPVDTGELISDQLQHGWWKSLLRSLADAISPEHLPPLYISSKPVNPELASDYLMVPRWSELLTTPKVFLPDQPQVSSAPVARAATRVQPPPEQVRAQAEFNRVLTLEKQRALRRAHLREAIWIGMAAVEVGFLVIWRFFPSF